MYQLRLLMAGIVLFITFSSAQAASTPLTFTFSNGAGESIGGHIGGLLNNISGQAADVWIDSYVNVGTGFPGSFVVPKDWGTGGVFDVVNGVITTAQFTGFQSGNAATQFIFNLATPSFSLHSFNNGADISGANLAFSSFPASVPEPASLLLLCLGLVGLGLSRYKKA